MLDYCNHHGNNLFSHTHTQTHILLTCTYSYCFLWQADWGGGEERCNTRKKKTKGRKKYKKDKKAIDKGKKERLIISSILCCGVYDVVPWMSVCLLPHSQSGGLPRCACGCPSGSHWHDLPAPRKPQQAPSWLGSCVCWQHVGALVLVFLFFFFAACYSYYSVLCCSVGVCVCVCVSEFSKFYV